MKENEKKINAMNDPDELDLDSLEDVMGGGGLKIIPRILFDDRITWQGPNSGSTISVICSKCGTATSVYKKVNNEVLCPRCSTTSASAVTSTDPQAAGLFTIL